jgi:hypothetical protein
VRPSAVLKRQFANLRWCVGRAFVLSANLLKPQACFYGRGAQAGSRRTRGEVIRRGFRLSDTG